MTTGNYPFMIIETCPEEGFISLPVAVAAVVAVVLLGLFGMMFQRRHGSILKSEQVIQRAERNGYIVEARLMQSRYMHRDTTERWARKRRDHWIARYRYVVNGNSFCYRRVFDLQPPDTLTLYYDPGKPGRAYSKGDREPGGTFGLLYAISIILMFLFLRYLFK